MASTGTLFIISAPSGAGKTSLVAELLKNNANLSVSISYTTRMKRPGEQNDVDYHFVDAQHFQKLLDAGELLEHAKVFGNYYGTSRKAVEDKLQSGIDVILEIDWQGAELIRQSYPDCVSIFILPPSLETLRERLTGRGQDAVEVIENRLKEARSEMEHYYSADYLIVNDNFTQAFDELKAIILSQRLTTARQQKTHADLIASLLC